MNKIWSLDLSTIVLNKRINYIVFFIILLLTLAYVYGDVMLGGQDAFKHLNVKETWQSMINISFVNGWRAALPSIWFRIAILLIIFRITAIIHATLKSYKTIGMYGVNLNFLTYTSSFFLSIFFTSSFYLLLNIVFHFLGIPFKLNDENIILAFNKFTIWTDNHIPHLFNVQNYYVALFLSIFITALPGYFIHRLCHSSRFFWYVSHRAHHVPQFLHPLSMPNAFNFKLISNVIKTIVTIFISSIIYTKPLVMEMTIWFTFSHFVEVFNHSSVYYNFALNNFIVRNVCRIFGEFGVYHIMHHSAIPEDHTINLSSGPFLFWDRIFGTYRKPYKQIPPIGLIHQPNIYMNPIRIHISGIVQLWYEWKENKNWKIRFNIIFGSVWYLPPITKNFLVKPTN